MVPTSSTSKKKKKRESSIKAAIEKKLHLSILVSKKREIFVRLRQRLEVKRLVIALRDLFCLLVPSPTPLLPPPAFIYIFTPPLLPPPLFSRLNI